jgi:hypothetical protein
MKRLGVAVAVLVVAGVVNVSRADEKASLTGTWKWTVNFGGQSREMTLKLKQDGDRLMGAMLGRDGKEIEISDAKCANGEVSFNVTRERNGQKFTTKYHGKVSGDTIKGKAEMERDGQTQSRDWEAKREK